jgi:hypothetical protein
LGWGEELAQLGDRIAALHLHPQIRQPTLREDRVDEIVAVPPFGQKVAAVVDIDRGDRIERKDAEVTKSTLFDWAGSSLFHRGWWRPVHGEAFASNFARWRSVPAESG